MKQLAVRYISCLVIAFTCVNNVSAQQKPLVNYSYKFKINGLRDTSVYLGFHYGEQKLLRDTARVNSRGEVVFKGKDTIGGGIYLFVLPDMRWFEFIVNEPSFSIETDTADLIGKMKVKNSEENFLWTEYLKKMTRVQSRISAIDDKLKGISNPKSKEYLDLEAEKEKEAGSVYEFRKSAINAYPNTFVAKIFRTMTDVEVPDAPSKSDGTVDSAYSYFYFRKHFFDQIDLNDSRLLRTPVLSNRINEYLDQYVPQNPDSLIPEVERIIELSRANPVIFKYLVHTLTFKYAATKTMCLEGVFVNLIDKYYATGQAVWEKKEQLEKMVERAEYLRPTLCNKTAVNIILPDTGGTFRSLYSVDKDITLLYFWDATCTHCQEATPQLHDLYLNFLKPNGVEVFAVEGELEDENWKNYIREHNLTWINVSDNPDLNKKAERYVRMLKMTTVESLNFREIYDLQLYPAIFVLDKNKKIIGKRLDVDQLKDFIQNYRRKH